MMRHVLVIFVASTALVACGSDSASETPGRQDSGSDVLADAPGDAAAESDAPPVYGNPLDGAGPLEKVQEGFGRIEGPLWKDGALFFTDIPRDTILRLDAQGVTTFRTPTGNSNGLAMDEQGRLIACEQSKHRVTRTLGDGTVAVIADTWQGAPFNAPNDATVRSDGNLYFTDPGFDYPATNGPPYKGVYRIDPGGALSLATSAIGKPNGITLSIDEHTLYVDDTFAGFVKRLAVADDGSVGEPQPFVTTSSFPDGMCIDDAGNLYVTAGTMVQVFAPDGAELGRLPVTGIAANCAFGGADRRTLYVTAGAALWSVKLNVPGRPY